MPAFSIIGLMSGSSLDGIDLAWCDFVFDSKSPANLLDWTIRKATTIQYTTAWQNRLKNAPDLNGRDLWQLHSDLGHLYGQEIEVFLKNFNQTPDFVASHGHTIFHFPDSQMTTQIGDGAAMAAELDMVVIDQFRSLDVALGGQGAPLAPLVDQYLFSDYAACLNLGGIANISIKTTHSYIAFDNGGANQVLNALCQELDLDYDDGGRLARQGKCIPELLEQVNAIDFFHKSCPKSLGNDWVRDVLMPYYLNSKETINDRLHTACVQIAQQIGKDLKTVVQREKLNISNQDKMLISGGGGFNVFLCELIAEEIKPMQLASVDPILIDFKEATLIALAGAWRW